MAILTGVGYSSNTNSSNAIQEACNIAEQKLNNNIPTFIIILASCTVYNQEELLSSLYNRYPHTEIIGCSTSGEISNQGPKDQSLVLMEIFSDQMTFVTGIGRNIKDDPTSAGRQMAEDILLKSNGVRPKAALILPDGLAGNGADIVRGILSIFGENFMLAGGSSGDDFLFKQTYQYYENKVISGSVVGVGFFGDFNFGIGVRHGWMPIGNSRKVTKSKSNILYTLDNQPAIQIYEDQFGKDKIMVSQTEPFAQMAITYPLGIKTDKDNEFLIRDPITVDANGAITCAAEVPEGSDVYIMIGSTEEAIEAANIAAKTAVNQVTGKEIKAAFLFNCIARKKLLMNKKKEEIEEIQKVIGLETPLIGFYTYGEQAPLNIQTPVCSFHNETDVLFLLTE